MMDSIKNIISGTHYYQRYVVGMAMKRDGGGNEDAEGWDLLLRPIWFCLTPSPPRPTPHDRENFPTPSLPLGALRSPAPPCKTLLFVNLPYN